MYVHNICTRVFICAVGQYDLSEKTSSISLPPLVPRPHLYSDDRSAELFRQKLEATTQMQAVLTPDCRPTCLIIDEIDGAPTVSACSSVIEYLGTISMCVINRGIQGFIQKMFVGGKTFGTGKFTRWA